MLWPTQVSGKSSSKEFNLTLTQYFPNLIMEVLWLKAITSHRVNHPQDNLGRNSDSSISFFFDFTSDTGVCQ